MRAVSGAKGIAKGFSSGDASRRRSQGLENLQEQLQGVMMEGNEIQVSFVMLDVMLVSNDAASDMYRHSGQFVKNLPSSHRSCQKHTTATYGMLTGFDLMALNVATYSDKAQKLCEHVMFCADL